MVPKAFFCWENRCWCIWNQHVIPTSLPQPTTKSGKVWSFFLWFPSFSTLTHYNPFEADVHSSNCIILPIGDVLFEVYNTKVQKKIGCWQTVMELDLSVAVPINVRKESNLVHNAPPFLAVQHTVNAIRLFEIVKSQTNPSYTRIIVCNISICSIFL